MRDMSAAAAGGPGKPGVLHRPGCDRGPQRRHAVDPLFAQRRLGLFRDELYYIACGQHVAFAYVDLFQVKKLV